MRNLVVVKNSQWVELYCLIRKRVNIHLVILHQFYELRIEVQFHLSSYTNIYCLYICVAILVKCKKPLRVSII